MNKLHLMLIFLGAGVIRTVYSLLNHYYLGADGILAADSHYILQMGQILADGGSAFDMQAEKRLAVDAMPLTYFLIAGFLLLFDTASALPYVLFQGWLDAASCVMIALICERTRPGLLLMGGVVAALNPTQIVLSGLLFTDTLFLFFATASLLLALNWMHAARWRLAVLLGFVLGLAAMTRPFILLWLVILPPLLLAISIILRRFTLKQVGQMLVVYAIAAMLMAPISLRNQHFFDTYRLSPQSGVHLLYWVVPLVKEFAQGEPRAQWFAEADRRLMEKTGGAELPEDPFQQSDLLSKVAVEELQNIGPLNTLYAWTVGGVLNLGSPAVLVMPAASHMERSGFYDTPGNNAFEKITNFIFHNDSKLYILLLLAGGAGVALWLLLGLIGLFSLLKGDLRQKLVLCFYILWIGYFLGISGPVASPKYRLPVEPVYVIAAVLGIAAIANRRGRRGRTLGAA